MVVGNNKTTIDGRLDDVASLGVKIVAARWWDIISTYYCRIVEFIIIEGDCSGTPTLSWGTHFFNGLRWMQMLWCLNEELNLFTGFR